MSSSATTYLRRCLELAERGRGWTHPNPMVGCVVVRGGRIVGEGWHRRFGGPHAEILALRDAGRKARGATLYVNLEPCAHTGKTPPCVDAIIAAGIRQVVASAIDPNPLVAGRGFRKLRASGIGVKHGVLRREEKRFNEKFHTFMERGVPFVGVKLAQTLDGRIADRNGTSRWITSPAARVHAHRLRSEYDAILVGATTVICDDPELTVRSVRGRNPVRVILDGGLMVPDSARVCRTAKAATIIVTAARTLRKHAARAARLERRGVQVIGIDSGKRIALRSVLQVLGGQGIGSVLVEGGADTVSGFLDAQLAVKAHWFVAPGVLGSGLEGILLKPRPLRNMIRIADPAIRRFGDDVVIEGNLDYGKRGD